MYRTGNPRVFINLHYKTPVDAISQILVDIFSLLLVTCNFEIEVENLRGTKHNDRKTFSFCNLDSYSGILTHYVLISSVFTRSFILSSGHVKIPASFLPLVKIGWNAQCKHCKVWEVNINTEKVSWDFKRSRSFSDNLRSVFAKLINGKCESWPFWNVSFSKFETFKLLGHEINFLHLIRSVSDAVFWFISFSCCTWLRKIIQFARNCKNVNLAASSFLPITQNITPAKDLRHFKFRTFVISFYCFGQNRVSRVCFLQSILFGEWFSNKLVKIDYLIKRDVNCCKVSSLVFTSRCNYFNFLAELYHYVM